MIILQPYLSVTLIVESAESTKSAPMQHTNYSF